MPEKYTTPYPAKRIHSDGKAEDVKVLLAKECPVKLFLNRKLFTTLFSSPLELKELAVGHLITEGVLSFREIENVEVEGGTVHIRTRNENQGIRTEAAGKAEKEEKAGREIFVDSDSVFDPQ
ncbi:formate dehydrogenase accessory sulfurtransferase FdhD, partial [Methanosarcina sp. UBA5]|uniref:formate dehydrogenase accessory sulfurtransferase FdhD n=1 Tax=Methanosarcina sp. UBA5 TaxID=1915593 RepID=UPI0025D4AB80